MGEIELSFYFVPMVQKESNTYTINDDSCSSIKNDHKTKTFILQLLQIEVGQIYTDDSNNACVIHFIQDALSMRLVL